MKALFICESLMKEIINKEIKEGWVHSVFSNACNIETENNFITLLNGKKGMSPLSLVVDGGEEIDFRKLEITRNMNFSFNENNIYCKEKDLTINLDYAKRWFPGVISNSFVCQEKEVLKNVRALGTGLGIYGKHYGISPLISMLKGELPDLELQDLHSYSTNKNTEFMRDRFLNFIQTVLKTDVEKIGKAAENIIGFGPGLTPAMDDFVCGIMISFIYFGVYYKLNISQIYRFNEQLISRSLDKTTRVSSEMLKHSAKGEVNQTVRELLQSILNNQNEGNTIDALIKTIDIGETSGSDIALGIYVGCKVMTNLKYRGEWLNESMY